jgi:hypothetical protein
MPYKLTFLFSVLFCFYTFSGHDGNNSVSSAQNQKRTITDLKEAQTIMKASEKEGGEWANLSCSKEGCSYAKQGGGGTVEEVFIPHALQEKVRKGTEPAPIHKSEYPPLNSVKEFKEKVKAETKAEKKYMIVKFGDPNHNCISCQHFDEVLSEPDTKKLLEKKKAAVYAIDVDEFKHQGHIDLAKYLGASVSKNNEGVPYFEIPFAVLIELDGEGSFTKMPILKGRFAGNKKEREKLFKWIK